VLKVNDESDENTGDVLTTYIAVLGAKVAEGRPMSMRTNVLSSLQRITERAQRFLAAPDDTPLRRLGIALELRDLSRSEQQWVDALLRDETPEQGVIDLLHLYKSRLAVLEATTMIAMAYVGSDREDDDEAGWWAHRAGEVIMEVASLAPALMELPD
jgi:hypothetical protein